MLRSVHLMNFVGYKTYQELDFSRDGPFIFVGENGSGKSSIFEGIRRCLKLNYSSSVSTVPIKSDQSYFICNFDDPENDGNIICGIVSFPNTKSDDETINSQKNDMKYYKFAMKCSQKDASPLYINQICLSEKEGLNYEKKYTIDDKTNQKQKFLESIFKLNNEERSYDNQVRMNYDREKRNKRDKPKEISTHNEEVRNDDNEEGSSDDRQEGSNDNKQEGSNYDNQKISNDDNKDGNNDDKQDGFQGDNKDGSSDDNEEGNNDDKQEEIKDDNKEGSNDDDQEGSNDDKEDESNDENQAGIKDEKQEGYNDDNIEGSNDENQEASNDERQEESNDNKQEGSNYDNQKISNDDNKEGNNDDKQDGFKGDNKEGSSDDNEEGNNDDKQEGNKDDNKEGSNDDDQEGSNDDKEDESNDANQAGIKDEKQEGNNDDNIEGSNDENQEASNDDKQEGRNDYNKEGNNDNKLGGIMNDNKEGSNDDKEEGSKKGENEDKQQENNDYNQKQSIDGNEYVRNDGNQETCTNNMKDRCNIKMTKKCLDNVNIKKYLHSISGYINDEHKVEDNELENILKALTKHIIFTFPLRSIGTVQWSKSTRMSYDKRVENYEQAQNRCEIIQYFLEKRHKFDEDKEKRYFKQLSPSKFYDFQLNTKGKVYIANEEFALLKTPEGILEAKAFSILMSNKRYKTIILEEPDRGMHPQLVERMLLLMIHENKEKRVILNTHQKGFIKPWTMCDTFIFRRNKTGNVIVSGKSLTEKKKIGLISMQHISEIYFARKVLFYEGDSEDIFMRELLVRIVTLESQFGENTARSLAEYTFIRIDGKGNRDTFQKISENLEIYYLFLLDRDAVPDILIKINKYNPAKLSQFKDDAVLKNLRAILEERKLEGQSEEQFDKQIKKKINEELKSAEVSKSVRKWLLVKEHTFFWLDGAVEEMVTTMCDKYPKLKKEQQGFHVIKDGDDSSEIEGKKKKNKLYINAIITNDDITGSVKSILTHCKENDDLHAFIEVLTKET